jgi:hypothetical protein
MVCRTWRRHLLAAQAQAVWMTTNGYEHLLRCRALNSAPPRCLLLPTERAGAGSSPARQPNRTTPESAGRWSRVPKEHENSNARLPLVWLRDHH